MNQSMELLDLKEQVPIHRPEMDFLSSFVGEWKVSGTMNGNETYEFLKEEFFLIYKWDREYGEEKHNGIGFLGFDSEEEKFVARFCDNLGYARTYDLIIMSSKFLLYGEHERAEISLSDDKQEIYVHWVHNQTGKWTTLCELRGEKVEPHERH